MSLVDPDGLQPPPGDPQWGTFNGTLGGANWDPFLNATTGVTHTNRPSDLDNLFLGFLASQTEAISFAGQFSTGGLGTLSGVVDFAGSAASGDPLTMLPHLLRLNWGYGTHRQLKNASCKDSHHIVQDAAVRDLKGYDYWEAPTIQLPGPSHKVGSPHYKATQTQRQRGGGTLKAEYRMAYKALRRAGLTSEEAKFQLGRAVSYFESLGYGPETPTRRVGNRYRPSKKSKKFW